MMPEDLQRVISALRAHTIRYAAEADVQVAVANVLFDAGIDYKREKPLSGRDRIDFLTVGGVGIELKVEGAETRVLSQLLRYAEHHLVRALVLVTTRAKHTGLPSTLLGKPLHVHVIGGLG